MYHVISDLTTINLTDVQKNVCVAFKKLAAEFKEDW